MAEALRATVAGSTSICTVADGHGLYYRGYEISDLCAHASFDEVAHLLLRGSLPASAELAAWRARAAGATRLPAPLARFLRQLPESADPMAVMQAAACQCGIAEPEAAWTPESGQDACERLLVRLAATLAAWHAAGRRADPAEAGEPVAAWLLRSLRGKEASPAEASFFGQALILYAEHEFNASTFTARVITATRADACAAVAGAIGALKGPLHGGANEEAMKLIESFATVEQAAAGTRTMLAQKRLLMGFGHAVYKSGDPRSAVIKEIARQLAPDHPEGFRFAIAEQIEQTMREEKSMFPNLDFYSACAFRFLGIPAAAFTPLFVCARMAGWGAHIVEQRRANRLIRPAAEYTGPPPRPVDRISEREQA